MALAERKEPSGAGAEMRDKVARVSPDLGRGRAGRRAWRASSGLTQGQAFKRDLKSKVKERSIRFLAHRQMPRRCELTPWEAGRAS